MTEIQQLNYHELRKNAEFAKENFDRTWSAARIQYDNLWHEHLRLLEILESSYLFNKNGHIQKNSPVFSSSESPSKRRSPFTIENKKECKTEKCDIIVEKNSSETLMSDSVCDIKEHIVEKSSTSGSPVFLRKITKLKKNISFPDEIEEKFITKVTSEIPSAFINDRVNPLEKTNEFPLKSIENDMDMKDFVDSNHENSSPSKLISKTKKLGFSILYNVDTKFTNNGKKVKQSKLIFQPIEKKTDISSVSLPEDNVLNPTDVNDVVIIEDLGKGTNTPNVSNNIFDQSKKRSSFSFNKHLQTKTLSQAQMNVPIEKLNDCRKSKHKRSEIIESPIAREKLKTPTPKCHRGISFVSPDLFDVYNSQPNQISTEKNQLGRSKQLNTATLNAHSPDGDETYFHPAEEETYFHPAEDETYFQPAEELENQISDSETKTEFDKNESPPAKRALINSFDFIPLKNQNKVHFPHKTKTIRNKTERAKLDGWDCSDCRKFYEGMGFSKKQLQLRKNQCSRHRAKYNQRACTPEGFWNPVFPDTMSSFRND